MRLIKLNNNEYQNFKKYMKKNITQNRFTIKILNCFCNIGFNY